AGVGPGRDVHRSKLTRSADGEAVSLLHDVSAGGPQLEDEGLQVRRLEVFEQDLTARGGRRDRVGSGLDVVGDHPVGRPAELPDALDLEDVAADSTNAGAHPPQEEGEIDDVRLAGRVMDGCDSLR